MIYSSRQTSNARFLVAKYIRDLHRLEPRNIGVIVWIDGEVSSKFLGDSLNDEIAIPNVLGVRNKEAYRQRIRYWREEMSRPALRANGGNLTISRDSPDFLDALRNKSRQNFVLIDAGFLTGTIDPREIDNVVHDLFEALVDDARKRDRIPAEDSAQLMKSMARAIKDSGIGAIEGYQTRLQLSVKLQGNAFPVMLDSGVYRAEGLKAVFQHANLSRPTSINSAAFMFDCISRCEVDHYRVGKQRCYALVNESQRTKECEATQQEVAKLEAFGTVIDLSQYERAVATLNELSLALSG